MGLKMEKICKKCGAKKWILKEVHYYPISFDEYGNSLKDENRCTKEISPIYCENCEFNIFIT